MCGIVGYIGEGQAAPFLLSGLSKLEYRGYDSSGIAVFNEASASIKIVKAKGPLQALIEKTDNGICLHGSCGIGHTRWATHGQPSERNAHPHTTSDQSVALVHNGIIENNQSLKEELVNSGYCFYSETDTEVAVQLVHFYYLQTKNPLDAIRKAMLRIQGSYAFGILFADHPNKLYAARNQSPLIVGSSVSGSLIASDVSAILNQTNSVYYMDDFEIAEISESQIHFYNMEKEELVKPLVPVHWDSEAAERHGYDHFMIKEIHEQPDAIHNTLRAYCKKDMIDSIVLGLNNDVFCSPDRIYLVACGSAYHAGVAAKSILQELVRVPVELEFASEFRYRKLLFSKHALVVVISQSGETADSLAALRLAKAHGVPVLGIVNVVGSSIARESDYVMYTHAGLEISVATTKAYSAQLIALYLLAIQLAWGKGYISSHEVAAYLEELERLPSKIEDILQEKDAIQLLAEKYADAKDVFFIGRGVDYAICMEGSLKLKEISYIHSEAYAAGELKHGSISLIEDGSLVIGVLTQPDLLEKTMNNLIEVKSRGAYLIGVTSLAGSEMSETLDYIIPVPDTHPFFSASLAIVPLQLFGYYVSVARGLDVDKPRNLAKSVTVE